MSASDSVNSTSEFVIQYPNADTLKILEIKDGWVRFELADGIPMRLQEEDFYEWQRWHLQDRRSIVKFYTR